MADCCAREQDTKKAPQKMLCIECGSKGTKVALKTLLHHLKSAWELQLKSAQYYFCESPDCDVVYFSEEQIFYIWDCRTRVGIKSHSDSATVCYCFGVFRQAAADQPEIKAYVTEQTKLKNCSCETSNPSGRCCLKDFPKPAD